MSDEAKKEQTEFEKVMENLRNYVCSEICTSRYYPEEVSPDELKRRCDEECEMSEMADYICRILNKYDKLKTDRDYWKAEAQKNAAKLGEIRILLGDV